MVTPPALIAATPVGATTAICLGAIFPDIFEKCRLARAGFTCKKNIA